MKRGLKADHPKEYRAWAAMKTRCSNPRADRYAHYGGRGIRVCERWHTFANFLADMGPCPSAEHSIGRLDNDANYSPANCRWETAAEQARNTSSNVWLEFGGERLILEDWAARLGIKRTTLWHRIRRGWSAEKALTTRVGAVRRAKPQDGEANSMAKLTDEKVRSIRAKCKAAGVRQCAVAREFGVSVMTVSLIVNNKTWRHVA